MNPLSTRRRIAASEPSSRASVLDAPPRLATLTNGRYSVRLNSVGSGHSECNGRSITRWAGDETLDCDGFYIYLRDLDDDSVWSAGYQPTRAAASEYEFHASPGIAEIARLDRNVECRLTVCVAPRHDCELRRVWLTNHGQRTRRIELTSYLEWVLCGRDADANHPAFAKLFVETEYSSERQAIFARRRPRSSDDAEVWGFHSIVCEHSDDGCTGIEFETNRTAFIGRGRNLAHPRALDTDAQLSGQSGAVLDPIGSLRAVFSLDAGESLEVSFVLGLAESRGQIDAILGALGDLEAIQAVFDEVAGTGDGANTENGDGQSDALPSIRVDRAERGALRPPHHAVPPLTGDRAGAIYRPADSVSETKTGSSVSRGESLEFDNSYGGFSADGHEYVMHLRPDRGGRHGRPPQPWVNVIANERAGCLVTESGAGYTWVGNSRLNRLSAWHNDPVCDPHSEAVWIRDEDEGVYWSPTPGPTPAGPEYIVRHGFGYTAFEHESHALRQQTTVFVARDEPVKITRLRLENLSGKPRRLSLFSCVHWSLGGLAAETRESITTAFNPELRAILATNPSREFYGNCVAFSALASDATGEPAEFSYSCDRTGFLGRCGDMDSPAALSGGAPLDGRTGVGFDPCAAWQLRVELPPGGSLECIILLGEADSRDAVGEIVRRFRDADHVAEELSAVQNLWRRTLSAVTIESPDREIDLMVNGWLAYQNLSCRIWARSAYYQPGGAFGYRDQLQDAAALIHHRPELTRTQILRHAAQQFVEGDILHWWHPDTGLGLRTRFSDDLLWLPCVTAHYVRTTGDDSVLDEVVPFVIAPRLAAGKAEALARPQSTSELASVYEHCCRALDRGLTVGPRGLPLMGSGDWNDGMNRVGHAGTGESVWLGFFIHHVIEQMLPLCQARGDDKRVSRYKAYQEKLAAALNDTGWDGAWYRRAYYDNGDPMGSATSDECQIDALAQAWAVISRVAPAERAAAAMAAVDQRLVCEDAGMIRLLAPPFDRTKNDPGYIKGYVPGIRENGGQYTHGVLWVVRAMAELGRGTRAVEMLKMLSPISHTSSAERTAVYQTEPYVVAADVYSEPPHVGRGGWTWYTGSAGWMLRVALESIFGMSIEGGRTMVIRPAISAAWPQCKLTYRLPNSETHYQVTIENPHGKETGVTAATLDGRPVEIEHEAAQIPLTDDGKRHEVVVRL